MTAVNINITSAGAQPTPPSTLRSTLINSVAALRPGYTSDLPGSLIEDIASTSVGALAIMDQAAVDLLNSMTPSTANPYLLGQIGDMMGIKAGMQSNSSAYILFTGIAGFSIPKGFIISDGLNQYTIQDGGALGNPVPTAFTASIAGNIMNVSALSSGQLMPGDTISGPGVLPGTVISGFGTANGGVGTYNINNAQTFASGALTGVIHGTATLYAVANQYGTWAIPAFSITNIVTSVPSGYPLICTNPNTGTIAAAAESPDLYRARVMNAQLAPAIGTLSYLKSLIQNVPGVQSRLVSIGGAGKIIVGGGDPYLVAGAIYQGLFDIGDMIGSSSPSHTWAGTGSIAGNILTVSAISSGAIQTNDIVSGIGLASPTIVLQQVLGTPGGTGQYLINYSQTVLSEAITGNGSTRNQIVSIIDYPDTYSILLVVPVVETTQIACTWSTISPNFIANTAIANAAIAAMNSYINSIPVGAPLNVFTLQQAFLQSVSGIINPSLVSALNFTITVNGSVVTPTPGTGLISGDAEGYYLTDIGKITVTRV